AGIFMVARMSPLFELSSTALSFVLVIGATTALFTGLIGIVQNDIKRVIAYSTLSQLGYMTVALGVSMYSGAVFHLMTHAFFKALLFLGAGSVIIAMHHEQDMRYMGGLRKYMPITWITMWVGSLALVAVPFTSGFYSKDAIIEAVGLSHRWGAHYAYFCVMAGALVTGLYTFRQMYLTFHGKERFTVVEHHGHGHDDHGHHEPGVLAHAPKESPWVVTLPLVLLAIPSLLVGLFTVGPVLFGNWFGGAIRVEEANNVLAELGQEFHGSLAMALHGFTQLPFLLVLVAFVSCTYIYLFNPALAGRIKSALKPLWIVLDRKYWVDNVYFALFARGGVSLGRLFWKAGDTVVIDDIMVNGSVSMIHRIAAMMRRLQSGYLYHYAFAMILGLILLLGGYWLFGSGLAGPVLAGQYGKQALMFNHLLSLLIWLPVVGSIPVLLAGSARPNLARWVSLLVAVLTFVVSLFLLLQYKPDAGGMPLTESYLWIASWGVHYGLAVDGISVALILMTTFVGILVIAGAWQVIQDKPHQYMAAMLMLEGLLIGVFCATDALLFYALFEAILIPMFILIGVWGGPRRVYATLKFFIYTFFGSVFMLI